jgi:hypothetical protein
MIQGLKQIERGAVRDRAKLFRYRDEEGRLREKGYMVTINPCSDIKAESICRSVHRYAMGMQCNTVLAIETIQMRGPVKIVRPHAHLLLDTTKAHAMIVAEHFKSQGCNVQIKPLYDAEGMLKYISKDPKGQYYEREVVVQQGSSPSAPIEAERAMDPRVPVVRPKLIRTEPCGYARLPLWLICWSEEVVLSMEAASTPRSRPVRVGMCRAP